MARFIGTAAGDTITPALVSNGVVIQNAPGSVVSPLVGDDTIIGNGGDDTVEGDGGADLAALGAGDDRFIWNPGDGDDRFWGGSGRDTLEFNGSDGAELMTITPIAGGFRFFRDLGDITVDSRSVEVVEVNALGGDDRLDFSGQTRSTVKLVVDAGAGADTVTGGAGSDEVLGGTGNDIALLGRGHDRFTWNPGDGDDTFDGGSGRDRLVFNGSDGAELMTITPIAGGFRFFRDLGDITVDTQRVEIVEVNALGGDDRLDFSGQSRSAIAMEIDAGAGDDSIVGGAGNDSVSGGTGTDVAALGAGNDVFSWDPGDGDDTFDGGSGSDTLDFDGSDGAELMTVTAQGGGLRFFRDLGDITVDTTDVERIDVDAKGGDDRIEATGVAVGRMTIRAGAGDDIVTGGRGNDWASLGSGDDRFTWNPGDGSDSVHGGSGTDRLVFNGAGADEDMTISSQGSIVTLFRDVGSITMKLTQIEQVQVQGLGGEDVIDGSGQRRADVRLTLDGGAGDDTLTGGRGWDLLEGAAGDDVLEGEAGADRFYFTAASGNGVQEDDVILDYARGEGDVLDLRGAGGFVDSDVTAQGLRLTLAGGDGDTLLLRGIDDLGELRILA